MIGFCNGQPVEIVDEPGFPPAVLMGVMPGRTLYRSDHGVIVVHDNTSQPPVRRPSLIVTRKGVSQARRFRDSQLDVEAVEIPAWVPFKLRGRYQIIAGTRGEEAAASWARKEKRR